MSRDLSVDRFRVRQHTSVNSSAFDNMQVRLSEVEVVEKRMADRFSAKDMDWAARFVRVLDEFRKINQDITANQIQVFVLIGLYPNIMQTELSQRTGLDDGTISRIVALLSDRGLRGREGLKLVNIGIHPENYRARAQTLSPQGRRVFDSVRHLFNK